MNGNLDLKRLKYFWKLKEYISIDIAENAPPYFVKAGLQ